MTFNLQRTLNKFRKPICGSRMPHGFYNLQSVFRVFSRVKKSSSRSSVVFKSRRDRYAVKPVQIPCIYPWNKQAKNWVQEAVSKESKYSEGLNSEKKKKLLKISTMNYSKCCVKQTLHKWYIYICEILINGPIRTEPYLLKFIDIEILKNLTSGQTVRHKLH